MDFVGIAAVITALTGLLTLPVMVFLALRTGKIITKTGELAMKTNEVVEKTEHIIKLTNGNTTMMQETLNTTLAESAKQASRAQEIAAEAASMAAADVAAKTAARTIATITEALRNSSPPTPATPTVVENITTETIQAQVLNVTEAQSKDIADAVVDAVEKAKPESS